VKKIIALILFVLYLVTSSGATINFHYCMGKFIGWDISSPVNQECSNCGMTKENKKGCCNDKQETLQLKKDPLAASVNIIPNNTFLYLNTQYFSSVKFFRTNHVAEACSAHGPPGLKPISSLVFNCVFRI